MPLSLRQIWSTKKKESFDVFKQATKPKDVLNAHTQPPPPYPLKFNQDLGPLLDKWEKLKAAKSPEARVAKGKALDVARIYSQEIEKHKNIAGYQPLHDGIERVIKALESA